MFASAPTTATKSWVDPRWYQIVFLSTFLSLGIFYLGWSARIWHYAAVIGASIGTQLVWEAFTRRQWGAVKSALISSLSLSLLLYTNSPWTMALAGTLAVSSKFIFRTRHKHFFNPANFAIILCILLTKDAWLTPGQWGHDMQLMFLFCATGLTVLGKVGRLDTSLVFLGAFLGLEYVYQILYLGWPHDVFLHKFTNGALLLFTFFMITDPRATPSSRKGRILWTLCIAITAFVVLERYYIFPAIFWALFVWSPTTLLFDRFFPAKAYRWTDGAQPATNTEPAKA
jgi:Na+-transporting NADH:ubiquinone oxidoreductase subunit NqrB